jgi:hypothetical protein
MSILMWHSPFTQPMFCVDPGHLRDAVGLDGPQMLEYLMMRGEVAIAGRRGRQRLWDLAERVYPADCPILSVDEAHRIKNERRLQSLGIARAKGAAVPVEPADVGDTGDRPPSSASPASGGSTHGHSGSFPRPHSTALLSPFDRLVGKLDAIAHRKSGTLLVHSIHEDVPFTRSMTDAVHAEIHEMASWLQ